jgi:predicted nucleotidyltransferase
MTRAELLIKLRDLKPWLAEQGIVNLRLFGSYARDEAGPDSDVDLLVDLARPMGLRFYSLAEDLSNPHVRADALRDSLAV